MRWLGRGAEQLRRLYAIDRAKALEFLERDPVDSVLARANLDNSRMGNLRAMGLFDEERNIRSFVWDSGNVIPLGFSESGLDLLADEFSRSPRACSSLVGPADQVLGLWERMEGQWGFPREVRPRQYSMVMGDEVLVQPDPEVRPALISEIERVFPASVAMFTEEVGYDPTVFGGSYRRRAEGLIRAGFTFVKMEGHGHDSRVVFKADVGALGGGVAQIQGVWTAPDRRGRGIATAGMAAVVELVRAQIAPTVSLYVNDYNAGAVAAYQKVGFRVVGEWATVLL
ncbi:GNAT family N-acetyltransferase [Arcanobacterium haemolyticum]|nr:GNAT family N-acetyltransferase [Arcanobacterium haemolyticum]